MAKKIAEQISNHPKIPIDATLTPTKHAGHAIELAETISTQYKRPLIISVSGDGGYNEVVNGAMKAKEKNPKLAPVVAVAGAGNANDHRRVMRGEQTLVPLVAAANIKPLDLIVIHVKGLRSSLTRYAHSYIGFGITPEVAVELNKHSLNTLQEIRIVIKAFLRYKPFTVEYRGVRREVDSLIFANINEMAKVLKLHQRRNVTDNQFEVIEFPHRNKVYLLYLMIVAAFKGLRDQPQYESYAFKTFDSHPVQLDGEVEKMPKRASITITSVPKAIDSLY